MRTCWGLSKGFLELFQDFCITFWGFFTTFCVLYYTFWRLFLGLIWGISTAFLWTFQELSEVFLGSEDFLRTTWRLSKDSLMIFEDFLITFWGLSEDFFMSFPTLSQYFLVTFSRFLGLFRMFKMTLSFNSWSLELIALALLKSSLCILSYSAGLCIINRPVVARAVLQTTLYFLSESNPAVIVLAWPVIHNGFWSG